MAEARRRGLAVIGELELAWRLLPNDWIAVTGTNGKTTTVELLGHVHREAGAPVAVGGQRRDGGGVAGSARSRPTTTIVCEASSFQLEDTEAFAPEAAVLLNLTEDHLDRHGTMDAYRAAKLQAFARQGNDDVAVFPCGLGIETSGGCARRLCFGDEPAGRAGATAPGQLWWDDEPLLRGRRDPPARSPQPRQRDGGGGGRARARAAPRGGGRRAAQLPRGRPPPRGGRAPRRRPVRQRLQGDQRRLGARRAALVRIGGIHAILGGRGKGGGYRELRDELAARAAAVYLIGEEAEAIAADLEGLPFPGPPLRRPRARGGARPAAPPARATSCSSHRPARAGTSTRTSRPAATTSAAWRGRTSAGEGSAPPRVEGDLTLARSSRKPRRASLPRAARGPQAPQGPEGPAARAPDTPHRDPVPARRRRSDGLQRVVGARAAGLGRRRDRLPAALRRLRRRRAAGHAPARAGAARRGPARDAGAAGGVVRARGGDARPAASAWRSTAGAAGSAPARSSSSPPS